jgi:sRNA-binding regulator protein Hfq
MRFASAERNPCGVRQPETDPPFIQRVQREKRRPPQDRRQMQSKTPMAITLKDGEVLKGVIEWYDRSCLKLNRDGEPNLLLYKSNIKYMYKDEEA